MQEAKVYSHEGPIRCRKRGYILLTCSITRDQSDAGNAGIFSRGTNQMQEAQVYSPDLLHPMLDGARGGADDHGVGDEAEEEEHLRGSIW
eukprot:1184372-Prorocentrum_minimum.AAC.4